MSDNGGHSAASVCKPPCAWNVTFLWSFVTYSLPTAPSTRAARDVGSAKSAECSRRLPMGPLLQLLEELGEARGVRRGEAGMGRGHAERDHAGETNSIQTSCVMLPSVSALFCELPPNVGASSQKHWELMAWGAATPRRAAAWWPEHKPSHSFHISPPQPFSRQISAFKHNLPWVRQEGARLRKTARKHARMTPQNRTWITCRKYSPRTCAEQWGGTGDADEMFINWAPHFSVQSSRQSRIGDGITAHIPWRWQTKVALAALIMFFSY